MFGSVLNTPLFFRKSNSGWLILILTNLDKISIILRFFFLIEISQGVRPCLSTDLNALTAPGWWRRYSASFEKLYLAQKWSNVQDGVSGSKWDNHKLWKRSIYTVNIFKSYNNRGVPEAANRVVLWKSCSWTFRNIYRKTTVLEFLFNKVAGLKACKFSEKWLQRRCFPVNFAKCLRTSILKKQLRMAASKILILRFSSGNIIDIYILVSGYKHSAFRTFHQSSGQKVPT